MASDGPDGRGVAGLLTWLEAAPAGTLVPAAEVVEIMRKTEQGEPDMAEVVLRSRLKNLF